MESLGEIKHIEIHGNVCYVLYLKYFSAILAYEIFSEIILKEEKYVGIRLIKSENEKEKESENEEKQKSENCEFNGFGDLCKWDFNFKDFKGKENEEFFNSKGNNYIKQNEFMNNSINKKGNFNTLINVFI